MRRALYLLFNEGYHGASAEAAVRVPDVRRGDAADGPAARVPAGGDAGHQRAGGADVPARGAAARARRRRDGDLAGLVDQDRSRWDGRLVNEGLALLQQLGGGQTSCPSTTCRRRPRPSARSSPPRVRPEHLASATTASDDVPIRDEGTGEADPNDEAPRTLAGRWLFADASRRGARAEPSASDRATARVLADEAGDALDKKNFEVAMDKFGRADALVHAPTLLLGVARAQVGLFKFVEAQESYLRILREGVPPGAPAAFAKALQDAERELKAIAPKLAWVTITVKEPATSVVTVDGVEMPRAALDVKRAVNPGQHVVKATADGYDPAPPTSP